MGPSLLRWHFLWPTLAQGAIHMAIHMALFHNIFRQFYQHFCCQKNEFPCCLCSSTFKELQETEILQALHIYAVSPL